jgi:hypothetical protein
MVKSEYHEGSEALERFNKFATQVFRAPKPAVKDTPKAPKRKAKRRRNPARVKACAFRALKSW